MGSAARQYTHDHTHDVSNDTHDGLFDRTAMLLEFCPGSRYIMETADFSNYKERKSVRNFQKYCLIEAEEVQ